MVEYNRGMAYSYSVANQESRDLDDIIRELISISYKGDLRMTVGAENKNKQQNIFDGHIEEMREIYRRFEGKEANYIFPKFLNDSMLYKLNRRSSARMALNQAFLNSFSKNVNIFLRLIQLGALFEEETAERTT